MWIVTAKLATQQQVQMEEGTYNIRSSVTVVYVWPRKPVMLVLDGEICVHVIPIHFNIIKVNMQGIIIWLPVWHPPNVALHYVCLKPGRHWFEHQLQRVRVQFHLTCSFRMGHWWTNCLWLGDLTYLEVSQAEITIGWRSLFVCACAHVC